MRVIGQETVAEVFGVTAKTIVEWQEHGFPIAVRGGPGVPSEYDTDACISWLVEREVKKVQTERPQDRLSLARAEKIEMENAERRGELAPTYLIEEVLSKAGSKVAGIFDAIPGNVRRMAPELPAHVLKVVIREIAKARNVAAAVRLADLDVEVPPDDID